MGKAMKIAIVDDEKDMRLSHGRHAIFASIDGA